MAVFKEQPKRVRSRIEKAMFGVVALKPTERVTVSRGQTRRHRVMSQLLCSEA